MTSNQVGGLKDQKIEPKKTEIQVYIRVYIDDWGTGWVDKDMLEGMMTEAEEKELITHLQEKGFTLKKEDFGDKKPSDEGEFNEYQRLRNKFEVVKDAEEN